MMLVVMMRVMMMLVMVTVLTKLWRKRAQVHIRAFKRVKRQEDLCR